MEGVVSGFTMFGDGKAEAVFVFHDVFCVHSARERGWFASPPRFVRCEWKSQIGQTANHLATSLSSLFLGVGEMPERLSSPSFSVLLGIVAFCYG